MITNAVPHDSSIPFLEEPEGQQMREKLWTETKAELSQYTTLPEVLAM